MSLHAGGPLLLAALSFDPVSTELCLGPVEDGARRSLAKSWSEGEFDLLDDRSEQPLERRQDVHTHAWLEHLYALGARGDIDAAIDLALDTLDDLLFMRKERRCMEILTSADIERMPVEVMLALLAGTLRARAALGAAREDFYRRAEDKLRRDAPDEVDALLQGLA